MPSAESPSVVVAEVSTAESTAVGQSAEPQVTGHAAAEDRVHSTVESTEPPAEKIRSAAAQQISSPAPTTTPHQPKGHQDQQNESLKESVTPTAEQLASFRRQSQLFSSLRRKDQVKYSGSVQSLKTSSRANGSQTPRTNPVSVDTRRHSTLSRPAPAINDKHMQSLKKQQDELHKKQEELRKKQEVMRKDQDEMRRRRKEDEVRRQERDYELHRLQHQLLQQQEQQSSWLRHQQMQQVRRRPVTFAETSEELVAVQKQNGSAANGTGVPKPWMQRLVTLCKDKAGRVGLRCQEINKGIFVVLVQKDSPASMAGLRFGDQILQINGETVAGYSMDKVHSVFRKVSGDIIKVAVRDRPFERTVTMHKDSAGVAGFQYTNGKIVSLVKDSSAARNGLLVEHNLLEINGQNVVGVKDNEVRAVIEQCGQVLTITVMPSFIYDHMMKRVNQNLIKKMMDHSIPDL